MSVRFEFEQIGVIRTPYLDSAPYQPVDEDAGEFRVLVDEKYAAGLSDLESFTYVYLLYYIDRLNCSPSMTVSPPWTPGTEVGLFATRSAVRPNPIGISICRIKRINHNEIFTSGLDVFDRTPLLDLKPYIRDLDSKEDANYGWLDYLNGNKEHLFLHIKGIPHEY